MTGIGEKGEPAGYDATLHLVTHAPVPDGLEERVHAALQTAPRSGRLLAWPAAAGWVRSAAAAAIVFVVAGGGWGVYRHAQLHQPAKVNAAPAPQVAAPAAGGFSSAGAIRTPQTVKGPAAEEMPKTENGGPAEQRAKKAGKRDAGHDVRGNQEAAKPETEIQKNAALQ